MGRFEYRGPFTRKLERIYREVIYDPYRKSLGIAVVELLEGFSRANMPERLFTSVSEEMGLFQCAKHNISDGRPQWAVNDTMTVEHFLRYLVPDELSNVGDGLIKTYIKPLEPEDFEREGMTIITDKTGNHYVLSYVEVDPSLEKDAVEIIPPLKGFRNIVP